MVKGRRAADRRREREGGDEPPGALDDLDDDVGTTPQALPAQPHSDYEEVDDDVSVVSRGAPRSAEVGDVQELPNPSRASSRPADPRGDGPSAARRSSRLVDDEPKNAEKSFARELKRRPREDTKAREGLEVTEVKETRTKRARPGGRFVVIAVDGQPAASLPAPPPATAGATAAVEAGAVRELPIVVFPSLLGRSLSADLVVADPTVSLRHCEIGFDADAAENGEPAFSVADLGSSGGTLKNGVVVDGRAPLSPGDVLQIGKTELRFLPAEKAPQKKPEPPPPQPVIEGTERLPERPPVKEGTATHVRVAREQARQSAAAEAAARRRLVRRRALLVIACCLGAFLAVVVVRAGYREAFSNEAPAQIRLQVSALLGEAREKLLQGDVDAAHARVGTILALDPQNDEARSLERTVTTEMQARDALQLALRMGDEDRDDEALAALARIADTSVFVRDRDRLKSSLAERALVRSLRAVEGLLDQGRVDEAMARAQAHVARFPDDDGGKKLLARVEAAKAQAPRDPALFPARAAFADGRVDEARAIADVAGYPGYVRELDRFQKAFTEGKAALARLDGAAARGPLDEAFRLLGSLGARASSPIFQTVQKPYADALYLSGTEKLEAGDGCGAARDLFKAARVIPDDGRVQIELQKLASRAEQGLTKAQGARVSDRERARAIAREHLCLAPTGTKIYDELNELSR